jgi:hypothetical protein
MHQHSERPQSSRNDAHVLDRKKRLMATQKLLPLSEIITILIVTLAAVIGGSTPDPDASAARVMSFYSTHDAREIASALALATSVPFLVFFAVALATALWPGETSLRAVWELVLLAGGVLAGGACGVPKLASCLQIADFS